MTNKPSLRTRKKLRTWDAIAAAGAKLFLERGFGATTLEQIAELADIHKQTVLRYFKTKEEIALAYQLRAFEEFKKGLLNTHRRESAIEFWRAHVERSAKRLVARDGLAQSYRIFDSDPKVLAYALTLEHQYQELLSEALSREAGVDPRSDLYAIALAGLLVAGNYGMARNVRLGRRYKDLERAVLSVVDFAIHEFPPRHCIKRSRHAKPPSKGRLHASARLPRKRGG
ncbi:MAG: TetR/AcrR family transcriptional regulator [Rhizomicrobium sp.]